MGPFEPVDSGKLKFLSDSTPDHAHFHQESRGPLSIFGERRVPCVRANLLSRCPETLAWIRAQGSHHSFPGTRGVPD